MAVDSWLLQTSQNCIIGNISKFPYSKKFATSAIYSYKKVLGGTTPAVSLHFEWYSRETHDWRNIWTFKSYNEEITRETRETLASDNICDAYSLQLWALENSKVETEPGFLSKYAIPSTKKCGRYLFRKRRQ